MADRAPVPTWQNRIIGSGWELPDQLVANPRNYRIHTLAQQEAVEGSLDTLGWIIRVTLNKPTGFVLNGHLRVALALRRQERTGIPEPVPVDYVDLTPDEEAQALASVDPMSAMAGTDAALLRALVAEVKTENADVRTYLDGLLAGLDAAPETPAAPEDFTSYDEDLATEHECPKCGYSWSGKSGQKSAEG
jgi:hypothetical protein